MRSLIRWPFAIGAVLVGVTGWAALDLYGPRSHDLRDFQPDEVGRLETAMWRSYYDRAELRLFRDLGTLLEQQYRLPLLRSHLAAFHAGRAAVVFQRGRSRVDYERALPDLEAFYSIIGKSSVQRFNVQRAARLELEWWIVHRERASHAPGDLARSLADLQAELYQASPSAFADHARERAAAMLRRDEKAEHGNLTAEDWKEIEEQLRTSWALLWKSVRG
jgi:hypothetical protein